MYNDMGWQTNYVVVEKYSIVYCTARRIEAEINCLKSIIVCVIEHCSDPLCGIRLYYSGETAVECLSGVEDHRFYLLIRQDS